MYYRMTRRSFVQLPAAGLATLLPSTAGAQPVAGDAPGAGQSQPGLTQKTAHAQGRLLRALKRFGRDFSYLHLSDGGHFENLALYELVRRHCRYVIVSDCGADADVAFDDLANAIRRIREDFGI